MPEDDIVRTVLRDQWHLATFEMIELPMALMSRGWEITAGRDRYVARLAEATARLPVEAGLAAAEHLRGVRIEAGEPVRTLAGALTVETPHGALAVLRRPPGRHLDGADPVDQQWWGERLGAVHRALEGFQHPGLRPWQPIDLDAQHLDAEPWLRGAVAAAVAAAIRLTVTDRLTYGVLHGDPAPEAFVLDVATGRAGLMHCGACGTGPLVYDVAAAIIYVGGPEHAVEMLDGYRSAGPVAPDELEVALPVLLRLRWAVLAERSARWGCEEGLVMARQALESMPG
ncbi:phosphotransferase enzyme family protein [Actinoplanes awajinensis]|uniref:Serine kinase n=1 Tax=Actinoplanes awajinensis subsp. mycoplanecinus TaxID=135947 RepID=A0A124G868_9ACTN|nr:phosphotransferase [Actinoplanes awajinensis]KUL24956.1 serine kinase [Actinoplanes awajinensis subsp. mycoplanecinus]